MREKISVAKNNEIIAYVKEAHYEYMTAVADAEKAEHCEVLPNCSECKGTGEVEIGTGDPAHNPTGDMLYGECQECEGKGYVEG